MLRGSIAAQRRKADRIFVSKSTVKDFGDRVEVNAFIYDGVEGAAKEEEKKKKARMGAKPEGGEGGGRRRRPTRLRALGSGDSGGDGGSGGRTGGARRLGGPPVSAGGMGFRRVGIGSAGGAGARGPARSPTRSVGIGPPRRAPWGTARS